VKKILLAISTVIYMVLASGIAMEIHYCMGKEAGIDFYGSKTDTCGKCGMKEKNTGCCHNEHQFYKLEDSHKNVFNTIDFTKHYNIVAPLVHAVYDINPPANELTAIAANNSPPVLNSPPIRIMYCVFRI
jgi:hypothetical protein